MGQKGDVNLRICHMLGRFNVGGAEQQVVNLLNALPSKQAFAVLLSETKGPLAAQLRSGVKIEHQVTRWRSLPKDMWLLVRILRRMRLDVLQTHMFWGNFIGTIAGKIAKIPVIVTTEHGKNEHKPRWARWVERHIISRFSDKRICVSDDIMRLRHVKDGVPLQKLCVVTNGTPIGEEKILSNHSPLVIGTVGRLIEAKDFPTLIKVAGILHGQGANFRLVIVGDGPEYERLSAEIENRGLRAVVDLPGSTGDVQAWLSRFDIYVLSSIREGQPLSMLEAMAVGLPIVATSVGGIPDTVEDGKEALLCKPGDAASLATALTLLAGDLQLRQDLGSAARRRLIRDFSAARSLEQHLEVYESVLIGRPGRSTADV